MKDGKNVIEEAKDIMLSHEAMERWDSIPAGSAMQINHEHAARQSDWLRNILNQKPIEKFKESNKASDTLDKVPRDLAKLAAKATEHLAEAHQNAEKYHTEVKQ